MYFAGDNDARREENTLVYIVGIDRSPNLKTAAARSLSLLQFQVSSGLGEAQVASHRFRRLVIFH